MDRTDLPIQAAKIDGQYIEDAIPGYQTVKVTGRETSQLDIELYSSTATDGEKIKNIRYPAKPMEVEFLVMADSMEQLQARMDHLKNLLSMSEADFVFNDEADKFWTGTPNLTADVKDYKNGLGGTYQIYCAYPFKRSVAVKTVSIPNTTENNSAEYFINYLGNYPARPVLSAEFAGALAGGNYSEDGDCGYVAFIDDDENIIQLGNPNAMDVDQYSFAGRLINSIFSTLTGWFTTGGKNYKSAAIEGSILIGNITDLYWNNGVGQTLTFAKPSFTGNVTSWHGPTLWKNTAGALNFELTAVHRMCVNTTEQLGSFEVGAYNLDGSTLTMVAGIVIDKIASGTNAIVRYIIDGKQVGSDTVDLSYYNTHFGYCKQTAIYTTQYYTNKKKKKKTKKKTKYSRKVLSGYEYTQANLNTSITKAGSQITFKVGNLAARTFTDTSVEAVAAHNASFHFGKHRGSAALHTNAVHSVKFIANPSDKFSEIPNVFVAGDIVEADCNDASVYLRRANTVEGHPAPQFGARGNNWEGFRLNKGLNIIKVVWSDWVDPAYKPVIKISYNEVYL